MIARVFIGFFTFGDIKTKFVYTAAIPTISEQEKQNPQSVSPLSSTYVKASADKMPNCGSSGPWKPREYYFKDSWKAERCDLNDGMRFEKVNV